MVGMLPLLAGCRLMFTAVIMLDIAVVTHSAFVTGKAIVGGGGVLPFVLWSDDCMTTNHLQGMCKDLIAFIQITGCTFLWKYYF